jgi:hypothetical protein
MDQQLFAGWRRVAMGDGVVLVAPDRQGAGRIRIRPQVAPLRAMRAVFAELLARPPSREGRVEIDGPHGMTTAEGEYGAFVHEVSGAGTTRPVQRTLVYIAGDASYALIDGTTGTPALFAHFRQATQALAYSQCLGLGSDRWRRYFYDPPEGWRAFDRGRVVTWVSADTPRSGVLIRVFDARPARTTSPALQFRRLFEQLPREFGDVQPTVPIPLTSAHGLRGELTTFTGPDRQSGRVMKASDAVLADARYIYFMRMLVEESALDRHAGTFLAMVNSVRPLPVPEPDVDVLIHWSD